MAAHIVISDLHLGSQYCRSDALRAFLDSLHPEATLVLAGDTLDDPKRELPAEHLGILERLYAEAARRPLVVVAGNHDSGWEAAASPFSLQKNHVIQGQVFVSHGDSFDSVMPHNRWFLCLFKRFHRLRVLLGAPPVHVAHYAKKWGALYRLLRQSVMMNAVQYARERGYSAAVCGHVHFPEYARVDGIDYFNTGSWTEDEFYYLLVDERGPRLLPFNP